MNKLKLILPFAGLATIPAIVMPITSCNKLNDYALTLDTPEEMLAFLPYEESYNADHPESEGKVRIQDALPDYIDKFNNINQAIGGDIVYNIIRPHEDPSNNNINGYTKIEITHCYFDTYEWRLTCNVKIINDSDQVGILKVSNLPYAFNPAAHGPTTMELYFSPVGVKGMILEDSSWTIRYKHFTETKETKIDHNLSLAEWNKFWDGDGEKIPAHDFLCFIPYYYHDCVIDAGE